MHVLSLSLEGKERNEEDNAEDIGQDSGPHDHSAQRAAGQGQPVSCVPDTGGGLVSASLSGTSSSLYSLIGTMREDGGNEAHVEEASARGSIEV